MFTNLDKFDAEIFFLLNGWSGVTLFDEFNIFLSSKVLWLLFFVVFAILTLKRGGISGKKTLLVTIIAVSFTDAFTFKALKENIKRKRPCIEYKDLAVTPDGCKSVYGFPSNHAANSAAVAAAVYFMGYKNLGLIFGFIALLVSLSRVFLGVHYPGDILVGMLSGALYSFMIVKLSNMTFKYYKDRQSKDLDG